MESKAPEKQPSPHNPRPSPRPALNIDIKPRGEAPKSYLWWWVAGAVVALLVLILLIIPAYKGYQVYKAMRASDVPESYATDMAGLFRDKTAAEATSAADKAALQNTQQDLASTEAKVASCKAEVASCEQDAKEQEQQSSKTVESLYQDLEKSNTDLQACAAERLKEKDTNGAVITDAARRLCCMQRVENPAINSFAVVDGRVVCVADGGTPISC